MTLTAQSMELVKAMELLHKPTPVRGPRPTTRQRRSRNAQAKKDVAEMRAMAIATPIHGEGFNTRQRRRAIQRACRKAGEPTAEYLALLEERTRG